MKINLEDDTIRYVLRRRRDELNKSTRDLEDHDISKGTISNIEKAKGNVKQDTLEIYLKKIQLTEDQVIERAKIVKEEMKEVYYQLEAVETIIEDGHLEKAKKQLRRFQLEAYHPLTPFIFFLQGRICYEEKEYKQAEKKFKHAIKLCNKYKFSPTDNIIAACYNELAKCCYAENDLDQALCYLEQGLHAYDETKSKKGIRYKLLGNQFIYLLKSSQRNKATRIQDKVWSEVEKLDNSYEDYPVLNIYKFRTTILRDQNMYEEAIECCNKGIQIARSRRSNNISHYLDFLILSGSIYLKQKEFTKAFDRFQLALDSDTHFRSPRRHVDAHTYLGILFISKKDWVKATTHLEEAIKIEQENPDPFRLAKALIVRGNVYYYQNMFSEALPYYQKAFELSRKYGYKQRQYTALLKSADCFDNMKNEEELSKCLITLYRLQKELQIKSEDEIYEIF
jgi:tetratricopeptide (TPR) repeat protein